MSRELHVHLLLVVVDDVLVCRTALSESVQIVHLTHVAPQSGKVVRDLELKEIFACGNIRS